MRIGEKHAKMYPDVADRKEGYKMSNKLMSQEDVERLSENSHVERISTRSITFTPEFKQITYDALCSGMKIDEILLRHGIDPMILGKVRVRGLQEKIEAAAKRPEGFANLRRTKISAAETDKEESLKKQLRLLQQELAYTRQEVEFLKKIRMADLEARKLWESKRPQK